MKSQQITFDWTGKRDDVDGRKIQFGETTELVNCRRKVDGRIQKRLGLDRTSNTTFTGGTYAGPATASEPADVQMWRDSSDQIWARDATTGGGLYRGKHARAHHIIRGINSGAQMNRTPCTVLRNSNELWSFTVGHVTDRKIYVTVTNPNTGAVVVPTRAYSTIEDTYSCDACVDGSGNVWFFHTNGGGTIYSCKFTAASTTPNITVYVSTINRYYTCVRAHLLTAGSQSGSVVVWSDLYYISLGNPDTYGHYVSFLDTSTGGPTGAVTVTNTQNENFNAVTDGSSMFGTGAGNVFYVAAWKPNSAADESALLLLYTVSTATLAVSATTTLDTVSTSSVTIGTDYFVGNAGGWIDPSTGDRIVVASWVRGDDSSALQTGADDIAKQKITKYQYNGSTVTETDLQLEAWLAGKPFAIGSHYYFLTGFDDAYDAVQTGYFLHDSDGNVIDDILAGSGVPTYHGAGYMFDVIADPQITDGYTIRKGSSHITSVAVVGTKAFVTLLQIGSATRAAFPVLIEFDFAAVYDSRASKVIAGGIPAFAGSRDMVRELAPIHGPYRPMTFTNGGGAVIGAYQCAYVYAVKDAEGNVTRSAPHTQTMTFNVNGSGNVFDVSVPTLKHSIGPAWIEFYMADTPSDSDLAYYLTAVNNPDTDAITIKVTPGASNEGELLYTTGGALENVSVPPARVIVQFGDRLWLFGTPDGTIWFSQKRRPQRGWEFNEALVIDWPTRSGQNWWAAQMAPDVLAFGDGVRVGLISGPGPDGSAVGAFDVQTLTLEKMPDNPKAVTAGPLGVYFQKKTDGRMCLLAGGQVTDINQGAESYRGFDYVAARHVEGQGDSKGEVHFVSSTGEIVVLDCDRPMRDQPAGQWHLIDNSNLPAWKGAEVVGGVLMLLDPGLSGTDYYWKAGTGFTDNGTAVLKSWRTGKMGLAGFLQEFDSDWVHFSSTRLGGDSAYRYTIYNDQGSGEEHTDSANTTADVGFRTARYRTREISMLIEETSATGEGRSWDGCVVEMRPYGRVQNHYRNI